MESGEFTFRYMERSDVSEIAELEKQCFSTPWSEKSLEESLKKPEYIFIVAEAEKKAIAYAGLIMAGTDGDITDVAVNPFYRRKRVAFAVMKELLHCARERGINKVFLEVRKSNEAAIGLYEKLGFSQIGMRKRFYSMPTEDAVLMAFDLLENGNF